ncbi:MAG: glycosyltransferase [bacterium]|nr:glycosyltransferase [bacterium]
MNILYLTYNSVMTLGILRSQVETLLKLLSTKYPNDLKFTLITVERWKEFLNQALKSTFRKELAQSGIRVIIIPRFLSESLRMDSANKSFWQRVWSNLALLIDLNLLGWITLYTLLRYQIQIIHTRSYIPGIIGVFCKKLLRKKFIFDPRGLIPEELALAQGWQESHRKYRVWKHIEKWLLKNADRVYVLSEPFAQHYQKIIPTLKPLITPCCVDINHFSYNSEKRIALRKKLGVEDNLVVVFTVGAFVPYQYLEGGIQLFQHILKLRTDALLFLLTPDKAKIQNYLQKVSDFDIRILDLIKSYTPEFKEMPDYLCACDIALLVRFPSIISKVASPVKFAEYLACGVPVIAYPNIGDTQTIIEQEQVGIVIDLHNESYTILQLQKLLVHLADRETLASRCRTTAINHLSWEKYLDLYYTTYQNLL